MHHVKVSIAPPDLDIAEQWAALCSRAAANVFMDPAALQAVRAAGFARLQVLLAWLSDAQPPRLIGLWALQEVRATPMLPLFLAAPPYNYAFLSNPVIDPEFMDEAIAAFLNAIERERRLPKILRLRCLDAASSFYPALLRSLAARQAHVVELGERQRAFVTRTFGVKRSGSTRRKLRQDWHRLCALGTVEVVNDRSLAAAQEAFETYLSMEAASWKGERGTALLCDAADAAFARRLISALAAERHASVALLEVDGRAIAAQVLLYCGTVAYTWKTAFDASFAKYSPGSLLVDKLTEQLFATKGIEAIDSCSSQGGFMGNLWDGRRATVDLVADLGTGKTWFGFNALAIGERAIGQLRVVRNTLRSASAALPRRGRAGL
jgi:CelD/BcsL family acetyltransferase involved in cellulose biosynthesis